VREKGYRQLKTMTPGAFGYSVLRSSVHSDLYHELLGLGQTMRFPIEGLHTETGPGVLEAALTYCDALEAADRAALFKTYAKVLAQRHGLMATFMAKWSQNVPGQSGHLHISLRSTAGESVFHDVSKPHEMSDAMRWFVGGQQALMPEFLAMVAGTVNSYSRLVPGYWAPTSATWGIENRTTALRVIRGGPSSQRSSTGLQRGYQSVHRARRSHRLRALGNRASHRAGCGHRRERLRPRTSAATPSARDAL